MRLKGGRMRVRASAATGTKLNIARRYAVLGMVGGRFFVWLGLLGGLATAAVTLSRGTPIRFVLPTGKLITPPAQATETGSFPLNMALSPDGKFVLVTDCGFREQLSVLDSQTGALVSKLDFNGSEDGHKQGLYFGLA